MHPGSPETNFVEVMKNDKYIKPPDALSATLGDSRGEVDLHWDAVKETANYAVQVCRKNSNSKSWRYFDIVTESRCTVSGLKPGNIYCFRVAAINSKDQSPWSKPVEKKLNRTYN